MADLERALAFWHGTLGLPVKARTPEAAELQTETSLVVLRVAPRAAGSGAALGWEADDLAATCAQLESRGVVFEGEAEDAGPLLGTRRRFRDPDGHVLELVSFR